jgi:hypothetical protein
MPIEDLWRVDDQTYLSTLKSGFDCPKVIQANMDYLEDLHYSISIGEPISTVIDQTLAGTPAENMDIDDWYYYYADIFTQAVK